MSLLDEQEFSDIKQTFQNIDVDHSGNIDKSELKKALAELLFDEEMDDQAFEEFADKLDFDKNGQISYSEFLSCAVTKTQINRTNLKTVFVYLDTFGYGYITKESLLMSFRRRGKDVKPD